MKVEKAMMGTIGIIETNTGSVLRAGGAPSVSSSSSGGTADLLSSVAPLSPRIKADPSAGVVIMEYLSAEGERQLQVPSQTVVAYLRSGLTEQGMPVKKDEASLATEA